MTMVYGRSMIMDICWFVVHSVVVGLIVRPVDRLGGLECAWIRSGDFCLSKCQCMGLGIITYFGEPKNFLFLCCSGHAVA